MGRFRLNPKPAPHDGVARSVLSFHLLFLFLFRIHCKFLIRLTFMGVLLRSRVFVGHNPSAGPSCSIGRCLSGVHVTSLRFAPLRCASSYIVALGHPTLRLATSGAGRLGDTADCNYYYRLLRYDEVQIAYRPVVIDWLRSRTVVAHAPPRHDIVR